MEDILPRLIAEAKSLGAPQGTCPRCGVAGCFKEHDRRFRQLLVIVVDFVVCCVLILKRWECSECHKTFTHYPEQVVPHKHYSRDTILALSGAYVEKDRSSYRSVVHPQGQALGYQEDKDGNIDNRQLSQSTVWRWLSWLGEELTEVLFQGLSLLKQKDPGFSLHRQPIAIPAKKYCSVRRKNILEQASRMLAIAPAFCRVFGRAIFPTHSNTLRSPPG